MLPEYLSISANEIRDAAAEWLRPDNRVVLHYVPDATIPQTGGADANE